VTSSEPERGKSPKHGDRPERVRVTVAELLGRRAGATRGRPVTRHSAAVPRGLSPRHKLAIATGALFAAASVLASTVLGQPGRGSAGPIGTGSSEPESAHPGAGVGEPPGLGPAPVPQDRGPLPGDRNLLLIPSLEPVRGASPVREPPRRGPAGEARQRAPDGAFRAGQPSIGQLAPASCQGGCTDGTSLGDALGETAMSATDLGTHVVMDAGSDLGTDVVADAGSDLGADVVADAATELGAGGSVSAAGPALSALTAPITGQQGLLGL